MLGFSVAIQPLEITHNIGGAANDHETVGLLGNQFGQFRNLGRIDNTQQHALGLAGVSTGGRDHSCGVMQLMDDGILHSFRVIGDDLAAHSALILRLQPQPRKR